jgi:hypothetical protein
MTIARKVLLVILFYQLGNAYGQDTHFLTAWNSVTSSHKKELQKINIIGNGIAFIKNGKIIAESMNGFQDKETLEPY